jgi:hypothetical protein
MTNIRTEAGLIAQLAETLKPFCRVSDFDILSETTEKATA